MQDFRGVIFTFKIKPRKGFKRFPNNLVHPPKQLVRKVRQALGRKGYQKPLPYKLSSKILKRKLKQRGK